MFTIVVLILKIIIIIMIIIIIIIIMIIIIIIKSYLYSAYPRIVLGSRYSTIVLQKTFIKF